MALIMNFIAYREWSPEQCFEMLKLALREESSEVIYKLEEEDRTSGVYKAKLWKYISYRNSFNPFCSVIIGPSTSGSIIEGRFYIHPLIKLIIGGFMVVPVIGYLGPLVNSFTAMGQGLQDPLTVLANMLCFPVFGLLFILCGRYVLGGRNEKYLYRFLTRAFAD
jgi:hypothetical protein